ncbi:MAG: Asp23/Gls24 family envelope stress response protein [Oscillospiraceae bacterium]
MIEITNHLGVTTISQEYFLNLIGNATKDCYGVVDMSNSDVSQSIKNLISKNNLNDKGVKVKIKNGQLTIDLHIIVLYGINISVIIKSIINKVKYTVKENTDFDVEKVNVYVDGMTN